jgi:hypothetical protein
MRNRKNSLISLDEVSHKKAMATPAKASPSMHSVCFHAFGIARKLLNSEQNFKRFFASVTKFWFDSTQTAQISTMEIYSHSGEWIVMTK